MILKLALDIDPAAVVVYLHTTVFIETEVWEDGPFSGPQRRVSLTISLGPGPVEIVYNVEGVPGILRSWRCLYHQVAIVHLNEKKYI